MSGIADRVTAGQSQLTYSPTFHHGMAGDARMETTIAMRKHQEVHALELKDSLIQ